MNDRDEATGGLGETSASPQGDGHPGGEPPAGDPPSGDIGQKIGPADAPPAGDGPDNG